MKKYELVKEDAIPYDSYTLYRIRALTDFSDVFTGELGGYIQGEHNLSHEGNCWVRKDARVYGNATVSENARVIGKARIKDRADIRGSACVGGYALVMDSARIENKAIVLGMAKVKECSHILGNAKVIGEATISGGALIGGHAYIDGNVIVTDTVIIDGYIKLTGEIALVGDAILKSNRDYLIFKNNWSSYRYFIYTRSNKMWSVGCFYGTGQELVEKAYDDSKLSGDMYKMYVELVEKMENYK